MAGIRTESVPRSIDGPSLAAAASGLMLLAENSSRLVRLHRLAALGAALPAREAIPVSPSALRSLLKRDDIGGRAILAQEDPYSEVLVQSVSFFGGAYLVSPGSGEHTVADLEILLDAAFREQWMPDDLLVPGRQLIQGFLTISDIVLKRVGLARGTRPTGTAQTPIDVPGAERLKKLTEATFLSNDEIDSHGKWLRMVVDTFALDPGQLVDPCGSDFTDDRLYVTPFLRLTGGYCVMAPLDLLITARFHFLRFARQAGQLEALGRHWRDATFRRFMRLLPHKSPPAVLEQGQTFSRYLLRIDARRDLHLVIATDPLVDWEAEVWGFYDTQPILTRLADLISPETRKTYSLADEVLHLVIVDSPGRGAFWGVPNVDGAEPVLIARSDDLEVMLHEEPDGPLGLLLFAQAIQNRPGESMSTGILDEFSMYIAQGKSFYFSDDAPANFTVFQTGDGLVPRQKFYAETDRHGVISPATNQSILQARRRYDQDAPEIFVIEPNSSYVGYVFELGDLAVFVTVDFKGAESVGVEADLLECVAYWIRECATITGARPNAGTTELVLTLSDAESWKRVGEMPRTDPAVRFESAGKSYALEFTETFVSLLQEESNAAERELVAVLLTHVFEIPSTNLQIALNTVAPLGSKRMLSAFDQGRSPDMLAERLPRPLTGHEQTTAQLLDELGRWLGSPDGGSLLPGLLVGDKRVKALNSAVLHLFELLQDEVATFDAQTLLDFLVAQNEALGHNSKFNSIMLKSRLACFGEQSNTVSQLVEDRTKSAAAHRANRFLIEYLAAQPSMGTKTPEVSDYYRLLSIAEEICERATASDFIHYGLADFEVSILESGRLGVSRDEPITVAMNSYAATAGLRSVRVAQGAGSSDSVDDFDVAQFITDSESAMRVEFGFTLTELREVCGGLLDIGAADRVTRIDRSTAVTQVAGVRGLSAEVVETVLKGITLTARSSFLEIGPDAWPWRFNRDMSYVRRPLVLQGEELVFGFRSIYRLGPYWIDNLLSGRLQGRARTVEMQRCISAARSRINDSFARSVAGKLESFGVATRLSVNKIGRRRIVDAAGGDLGDIDILAVDPRNRAIIAIEAKDFEIARTPGEIANELAKLFSGKSGKKPTTELHLRRVEWLRNNVDDVVMSFGVEVGAQPWKVVGTIVTSDPLITPLVSSSPFPVIAFDDLGIEILSPKQPPGRRRPRGGRGRK